MAKKRPTSNKKKAAKKAVKRQTTAAKSKSRYAAKAKAKSTDHKWKLTSKNKILTKIMAVAHTYIYNVLLSFGKCYQNDSGFTRVDATRPMSCCVTPEDLELAEACSGNFCAVARVLARSFGSTITAAIVGYRITIVVDDRTKTAVRFRTPDSLRKAIVHFDETKQVRGRGEWLFTRMQFELKPLPKGYFHSDPDTDGLCGRWHKVRNSGGKQSKLRKLTPEFTPRRIEGIDKVLDKMSCGLYSVATRSKTPLHEAAPVIAV